MEIRKATKAEVEVERQRINNLATLKEGSTTGDAELLDIRVGAEGEIYDSSGDHVRSIERITSHQNLMSIYPFKFNGFISEQGNFVSQPNDYWMTTDYILCESKLVYLDGLLGVEKENVCNIWCYDADKNPISGLFKSDGSNLQHYKIELPITARFIRIVTQKLLITNFRLYTNIRESELFPEDMEHSFCWINGELHIDVQFNSVNNLLLFKVYTPKTCYIISKIDNHYIEQFNSYEPLNLTTSVPSSSIGKYWMLYLLINEKGIPQLLGKLSDSLKSLNKIKYRDNKAHLIGIGYSNRIICCNPNSDIINNGIPMSTRGLYTKLPMIHGDLCQGAIEIDIKQNTIQLTKKGLIMSSKGFFWLKIDANPRQVSANLLTDPFAASTILVYNIQQDYLDLILISEAVNYPAHYVCLGEMYGKKFYDCNSNPSIDVTIDGILKPLGDWLDSNNNVYIPLKYKNYITSCINAIPEINLNSEKDGMSDIIVPMIIDTMENRQLSIYYDCLSRFENTENLWKIDNPKKLTRNEQCITYNPSVSDNNFSLIFHRLNRITAENQESKIVTVRVNHKLPNKVTKNICICGDSLVDNGHLATEVYRLLTEDNDCIINQIGTRGTSEGRHEGRGSWTWKAYLENNTVANKTNAFWDTGINGLNFKKYCETNGFRGIDYFLIALGTNDVTQGGSLYITLESVQVFIDRAKLFINALLSAQYGFPNCKVGIGLCGIGADYFNDIDANSFIFRKSMNTLNLAYLENFDNGKYNPNVTCFSHGMMTNRKYAFPYSNNPISNRYPELSRTLTNGIHPSPQGYKAWADGYYNLIRGFLTQDNK